MKLKQKAEGTRQKAVKTLSAFCILLSAFSLSSFIAAALIPSSYHPLKMRAKLTT